jgi:signal transduction histidine kinase
LRLAAWYGVEHSDAPGALGQRTWLTGVGFAVVALVVVANAGSATGLGSSGGALVVVVGVAVYAAAALVFLMWFDAPRPLTVGLLLVMGAAATATHHADPAGTGGVGLYLGVAFAPLRLPRRTATVVAALTVLMFDVHLLLVATDRFVFVVVVTGGSAFFFMLGLLLRSEAEQRQRADRLVRELERSRAAERHSAVLAERGRLSREMHDVLAHTLTGLVLHLEALAVRAQRDGSPLADGLERSHALARDGLREARQAVQSMRGGPVPGPEALPQLVEAHERTTGQRCTLRVSGAPLQLAPDARLAVYRTAQEGLANARKHASGAAVEVRLTWREDGAALEVVDDGGLPHHDLQPSGAGAGLAGLAERAALAGGSLRTRAAPTGFRLELRVPAQRTHQEQS